MKKTIKSTMLFLLICLFSCSNDATINTTESLIGTWELVEFREQTATTSMNDLDNSGSIVISFSNESFEGDSGRNGFFGDYTIQTKGLLIFDFFTSEVNESEWGQMFYDAIGLTYNSTNNNYQMSFDVVGNTLIMEYEPNRFMDFNKL